MSLPSLGSAVGSGVTCGSPWSRKGMVLRSVLSTNTKQASPQSIRFHVNIRQARTAFGSAVRFYRSIYSSVYYSSQDVSFAYNSTECETRFLFHRATCKPRGPTRKRSRTLLAEIQTEIQKSTVKSRNSL